MGTAKFPLPENISETLSLLSPTGWNLTMVEHNGNIRIISGDQLVFTAHSPEEAEAFLAGCFLATFMGNSLQHIQDEVQKGNFIIERDWHEMLRERFGSQQ